METTQPTTHLYEADVPERAQRRALTRGDIPIAVYGLGKMGLPLATVFAESFGSIIGVDIDESVVDRVNDGDCPVQGEPGLEESLQAVVADGSLHATVDGQDSATRARVHTVIVPTVLDENDRADLSALEAAILTVASGLEPGDMVVVESTLPPGTCRDLIQPTLVAESGLGSDSESGGFGLAFCPERTASGRALRDIRGAYPKVVGGRDRESTRVASLLYSEVTENDVVAVSDCTTAECVKLFEGIYRDVNIALANELAKVGRNVGVNVHEAIDVANGPGYCDIHRPGPGVGGHCIPYYPHFVMGATTVSTDLLRTARAVNDSMPVYTVDVLEAALAESGRSVSEATVALLGITYRAGVDETRHAPAFPIAEELTERGATVYAVDPVCLDAGELSATRVSIDQLSEIDLDAAVLVTAHEEFHALPWTEWTDLVVLDGRRALENDTLTHDVYTLGDGRQLADRPPVTVSKRTP